MVTGQIIPTNPAAAVRGPRLVVKRGKTSILTAEEIRELFDSFPATLIGMRDRALCSVLVYSFARISAALGMDLQDYYTEQRKSWFRLAEKGGRQHAVVANHYATEYVDAYIEAAGFDGVKAAAKPLFRTVNRARELTPARLTRNDALQMIRRRVKAVGIKTKVTPHSFRATGITLFVKNGGLIHRAQKIAGHASPQTTQLYNRANDEISLDDVELIRF